MNPAKAKCNALLEFHSGVFATVITSFEAYGNTHPRIEVYGDQGTMTCPDPNTFGGPVKVLRNGDPNGWQEMSLSHIYSENSRSLGLTDPEMDRPAEPEKKETIMGFR